MTGRFVRSSILALAAALASLPLVSAARAGDFSAEYVFGDSLSDNGNLAELLNAEGQFFGNFPNPPSFHDSFTNGPVAVAGLAQNLGLSLTPSLWVTGFKDPAGLFGGVSFMPGTNYAVAGALSATPSPVSINLLSQVGAYSAYASGHADPDALYVIMIGGNDVRDAALDGTGQAAVTAGVDRGIGRDLDAFGRGRQALSGGQRSQCRNHPRIRAGPSDPGRERDRVQPIVQ